MSREFNEFFLHAMGEDCLPYPYQQSLGLNDWPDLIDVPTGLGKTAAVVLSWLYKQQLGGSSVPKRLVYCLPMRVLAEQTVRNTRRWIHNLEEAGYFTRGTKPGVHLLMGGDVDRSWDQDPDRHAVLVGTQDQLLSRALNRGYGVSRFRWPVQFGLLNNDCLWVMDEVQLMGSGLSTTTQLEAFRRAMGVFSSIRSIWMSATLTREWLKTVDFRGEVDRLSCLGLSDEDLSLAAVQQRYGAKKPIQKAHCDEGKEGDIAKFVADSHVKGTLTLVVVNTVNRATSLFSALEKKTSADLVLLHSRFRPGDREAALARALGEPGPEGKVCVSTQVVEAGVDISAETLITDIAPWSSLVQRFGRCNRYGEQDDAKVYWIERDLGKKGVSLPYTDEELHASASLLQGLKDVGIKALPKGFSEKRIGHVLRRKDILELFDTTPDLAGADIDVSRFIRETDDHDAYVFWRDLAKGSRPSPEEPKPSREELCSVPVGELRAARDRSMWVWDHLDKAWVRPTSVVPGMLLMVPTSGGGYSDRLGWTGKKEDVPSQIEPPKSKQEGYDDDPVVSIGWQSLSSHTDAVVEALKDILESCPVSDHASEEALLVAARWHDVGKAHPVFQKAMLGDPPEQDESVVWAKTGRTEVRYERKGFRHELASALAMIGREFPDLAIYLTAAHHGKVRLSIRSLPHESTPPNPSIRFARGIWEGDHLPALELGNGARTQETTLSLDLMELGLSKKNGPSWIERSAKLLHNLGPFRLAYLEALLRVADWRASSDGGFEVSHDQDM